MVGVADGHVHGDKIVLETHGGIYPAGPGVIALSDADPGQAVLFGLGNGQFGRPGHHDLTQAVVPVHQGADRGLPFDFNIGMPVVTSFPNPPAITRQTKKAVSVHASQIRFDHAQGANARVFLGKTLNRENSFDKTCQPLH